MAEYLQPLVRLAVVVTGWEDPGEVDRPHGRKRDMRTEHNRIPPGRRGGGRSGTVLEGYFERVCGIVDWSDVLREPYMCPRLGKIFFERYDARLLDDREPRSYASDEIRHSSH